MRDSDRFCYDLVAQRPELQHVLAEHLEDNDGLLPYLFLADVARWLEANIADHPTEASAILGILESAADAADPDLRTLIFAGFVEALTNGTPVIPSLPRRLRGGYHLWSGL